MHVTNGIPLTRRQYEGGMKDVMDPSQIQNMHVIMLRIRTEVKHVYAVQFAVLVENIDIDSSGCYITDVCSPEHLSGALRLRIGKDGFVRGTDGGSWGYICNQPPRRRRADHQEEKQLAGAVGLQSG